MLIMVACLAAGVAASCSSAKRGGSQKPRREPIFARTDTAAPASGGKGSGISAKNTTAGADPDSGSAAGVQNAGPQGAAAARTMSAAELEAAIAALPDSLSGSGSPAAQRIEGALKSIPRSALDSVLAREKPMPDSLLGSVPDSVLAAADSALAHDNPALDSLLRPVFDSLRAVPDSLRSPGDSVRRPFLPPATDLEEASKKPFLEQPIFGKNRDSLIYDVKNRLVFVYGAGDLTYEENNLKADRMILDVETKEIFGTGQMDTMTKKMTRPEFTQASGVYTMDTLRFNLESKKAKIIGVAMQDGEGFLTARESKKMDDNVTYIRDGRYTTCDHLEHPHFYIAMTKAKVIPGKKIVTGPAYFVIEDVPLYLGIPGGFFPITAGPQSGFIFPTYGEEARRGFYIRDGGYYFRFGDYADLALTANVYTLGSWGVTAATNYALRYKFAGNLLANYEQTVLGEKNTVDYQNSGQFKLQWSHKQDPKFHPSSQFSASVNFSTAGYNKSATTSMNDHLNTQTNSSVSYSKSWTAGTTSINLTLSFRHSQNSRDSTISLTLPDVSFSVGSFAPFKRKNAAGKQKWYEKITISYSMSAQNSTGSNTKERDLFTRKTVEELQNGIRHSIPVKTSFNILKFISFSPSLTYNEVWNFKRRLQYWDPGMGENGMKVEREPEFGFYRSYNFSGSGSFSTKLYGMFQPKRKEGKTGWLQAVRHVMTPTIGFTLAPNFKNPRFGMQHYVQSDQNGTVSPYNPYLGSPGISMPGEAQAAINFSLSNQLEMKVKGKRDTTANGRKIVLLEQLSLSGSYDFLRDSNKLSNISLTFRTGPIFKNFAVNVSATWDPYKVINEGGRTIRTRYYNVGKGKFGRIANAGTSLGYSFNSNAPAQPALNDMNSPQFVGAYSNPYDMSVNIDPATRRQYMAASYYDFNIPWQAGINYSVNYTDDGVKKKITQTLGFNGSLTITGKWGFTFSGGFDIAKGRLTPMQLALNRDLHCWAMSFSWVPFGQMKSYMFHIGVKAGMLRDLKYDKQSSRFDNLIE